MGSVEYLLSQQVMWSVFVAFALVLLAPFKTYPKSILPLYRILYYSFIPYIVFSKFTQEYLPTLSFYQMEPVIVTPNRSLEMFDLTSITLGESLFYFICCSWFIGVFFLFKNILNLREFRKMGKGNTLIETLCNDLAKEIGYEKHVSLIVSKEMVAPFSFGVFKPAIVISEYEIDHSEPDALQLILRHELTHLKMNDFSSNVFQKLWRALFYFNPVMGIMDQALEHLRELRCDEEVLKSEKVNKKRYAEVLYHVSLNKQQLLLSPAAVAFVKPSTFLKRRIQMIKQNVTKHLTNGKKILIYSGLIGLFLFMSCNSSPNDGVSPENSERNVVHNFSDVAEKPSIIKKGIPSYPKEAQKAGLEGSVLIHFTIDENGNPQNINIIKSVPGLDESALTAAKDYRFSPAKDENGNPIAVNWTIPFRYRLNK